MCLAVHFIGKISTRDSMSKIHVSRIQYAGVQLKDVKPCVYRRRLCTLITFIVIRCYFHCHKMLLISPLIHVGREIIYKTNLKWGYRN